jgi:hypothetical protein
MTAGRTLGSCGSGRGGNSSTSRSHQSGGRGRRVGCGGRGRVGGGGRGCRRIREDVGCDVAGVSKSNLLGAVRQRNDLDNRKK